MSVSAIELNAQDIILPIAVAFKQNVREYLCLTLKKECLILIVWIPNRAHPVQCGNNLLLNSCAQYRVERLNVRGNDALNDGTTAEMCRHRIQSIPYPAIKRIVRPGFGRFG